MWRLEGIGKQVRENVLRPASVCVTRCGPTASNPGRREYYLNFGPSHYWQVSSGAGYVPCELRHFD